MIERIEKVGECPIGTLYKRVTIDRFGFIFKTEYFKDLNPIWKYHDYFGDEKYSYSDHVYYSKKGKVGA